MSEVKISEERYQELLRSEKKLEIVLAAYPEFDKGYKVTPAVKRYKSALESLAAQVEKVMTSKELASIFEIAYVHGFKYSGPTFVEEMNKVNKLLRKI